jgi:hypothetical protein
MQMAIMDRRSAQSLFDDMMRVAEYDTVLSNVTYLEKEWKVCKPTNEQASKAWQLARLRV